MKPGGCLIDGVGLAHRHAESCEANHAPKQIVNGHSCLEWSASRFDYHDLVVPARMIHRPSGALVSPIRGSLKARFRDATVRES